MNQSLVGAVQDANGDFGPVQNLVAKMSLKM